MIRVLVVEDSPSVRELLARLLRADGSFEVVGTASDGAEAVALATRLRPDVITMDVHMPRMDGVEATRRIMAQTPAPIVIVSASILSKEVALAFEAIEAGAVTVIDKPPGPGDPRHGAATQEFLTTVRLMSQVKVVRRWAKPVTPRLPEIPLPPPGTGRPLAITLAASAGGPQAIEALLQSLGTIDVPVLAVQHMSHGFMAGMATWLNSTCPQTITLAGHGERPAGGTVYLAPDDQHLLVTRQGALALSKAPPVRGFRPSANLLFESAAESYGARAVGIILSGMGDDGVAGLGQLRAAGAPTVAQDEATSVVYGMPGAAVAAGAAGQVLPLPAIGPAVRKLLGLDGPPK